MKKGFTLVELIVVVIIIGILAAVGVPQLRRTLERARGAEALSGLGHIQSAQKVYYALNENYLSGSISDIQNVLDINIAEENWKFEVMTFQESGSNVDDQLFLILAERDGGPCNGRKLAMTDEGMVEGSAVTVGAGTEQTWDCWNDCVDDL